MTVTFCVEVLLYFVTVFFSVVTANEESVTINRPVSKTSKPWHFSTDYVRCFCNLPSCVTTGYMCKSSGGGCFSEVSGYPASVYRGRHGCLELLDDQDQKSRCHKKRANDRTTIRRKENPKSLLMCCHHDMCNHVESPQTKNLINETLLDDVTQDTANRYQQQDTFLYSDSDVWFRAATIAVPICGAVILFVLIALAVKILKNEHESSTIHKLGPAMYVHAMPQQPKGFKDAPMGGPYDRLLRAGCAAPSLHREAFRCPGQHRTPLLQPCAGRYDLMAPGGAAIILDIEKSSQSSAVNYVGGGDKVCAGKTFAA